jgi:predicted nucleic acid-binding protein
VEVVILDASPLVAYLDADETHHEWCVRQFEAITQPVLSCEPALAEAIYLIISRGGDASRIFELLRSGEIKVPFQMAAEAAAIAALMRRYSDLPMDLADACLVRMAEIQDNVRVFTLDRHFRIYRRHGRQTIPLISPE